MPPTAFRLFQLVALISITVLTWPYPGLAAILIVTDFGDSGAPGQLRTLINAAVSLTRRLEGLPPLERRLSPESETATPGARR